MSEPALHKQSFICPHCKIHSSQKWFSGKSLQENTKHAIKNLINTNRTNSYFSNITDVEFFLNSNLARISDSIGLEFPRRLSVSTCSHCMKHTYWNGEKLIYPRQATVQPPNENMPDSVKKTYLEASRVLEESPRSAAALLRLALQELLPHLGAEQTKINDGIAELVKNGIIDEDLQKALDSLRVIGNEAVHPATIDFTDSKELASSLFEILNYICEQGIGKKKKREQIYSNLPENKKKAIAIRDTNK